MQHHLWIASRLSRPQRDLLRALVEGRIYPHRAGTMQVLMRRQLVEVIEGAPKVTELGRDVLG